MTVNVRMQCPLPDLVRVLYELENSVPLVFVDSLEINQRTLPGRQARRGAENLAQLDVRFNMYGYRAQPGAEG